MHVLKGNHKLYHIQSVTDWSDSPIDLFIWSIGQPTPDDIKLAYLIDRDTNVSIEELEDFLSSAEVYTVYTTKLKGKKY